MDRSEVEGRLGYNEFSSDLGGFVEQLSPKCFAGWGDVVALWSHRSERPLGRVSAGTLTLSDGPAALTWRVRLPESAPDVREAIERRDVVGASFGMIVTKDRFERLSDGRLLRTIEAARLVEVSPTALPAYESSSVRLVSERSGPASTRPGIDDKAKMHARHAARRRQIEILRTELRGIR